jgi:hypothetical protein
MRNTAEWPKARRPTNSGDGLVDLSLWARAVYDSERLCLLVAWIETRAASWLKETRRCSRPLQAQGGPRAVEEKV